MLHETWGRGSGTGGGAEWVSMHAHVCCVCVVLCCSNVPSVPLSPPTVSRCLCRVLLCMLCLPSCHTCIPVVVVVTLSLPCRHDLAVVGRSSVVGRRSLVHLVVVGRRSVVVMVRFGSVRSFVVALRSSVVVLSWFARGRRRRRRRFGFGFGRSPRFGDCRTCRPRFQPPRPTKHSVA